MPLVVTLALKLDVPDTDRIATPVMLPSMSALPVMVRLLLPPATVEAVLMVEPVKVVLAPKVMASRYV